MIHAVRSSRLLPIILSWVAVAGGLASAKPVDYAEEIQPILDRRCLDSIARHKRPKSYRVVQQLPRNSAGKVLKTTLRERYVSVGGDEAP